MLVFSAMLITERWQPKRAAQDLRQRYIANGGIFLVGVVLLQLLEPVTALAASAFALHHNLGLFNLLQWNVVIESLICIVLLDAAIYLQHVMTHKVPVLWSLHRVHHYDCDVDVSTALRFHPVEIALSMIYKSICVILLGAPLIAVLIFEVLLNALAMFNHANIRLGAKVDRVLRCFIVTPDMHVIHHSQDIDDSNRNFGFGLSCWDRLFGSYAAEPRMGLKQLCIGQLEVGRVEAVSFLALLMSPFKR